MRETFKERVCYKIKFLSLAVLLWKEESIFYFLAIG